MSSACESLAQPLHPPATGHCAGDWSSPGTSAQLHLSAASSSRWPLVSHRFPLASQLAAQHPPTPGLKLGAGAHNQPPLAWHCVTRPTHSAKPPSQSHPLRLAARTEAHYCALGCSHLPGGLPEQRQFFQCRDSARCHCDTSYIPLIFVSLNRLLAEPCAH